MIFLKEELIAMSKKENNNYELDDIDILDDDDEFDEQPPEIDYGDFHQMKPAAVPKYASTQRIRSVHATMISHDAVYEKLKEKGEQIDINNPKAFGTGNKRLDNNIFSIFYGPESATDQQAYSCKCRKLTGSSNYSKICPECGTEVKAIEVDLSRQGHIDISPFHILSYHGYNAMKKVYKNLDEILTKTRMVNIRGKVVDNGLPTIMDLYDDYDEEVVGIPRDIAFMSKIPVYSAKLRPLIKNNIMVSLLDENKRYMSIVNLQNILKVISTLNIHNDIQVQKSLNQIQQDFLEICKIVKTKITGKDGSFRQFLASGRIDNSSRMVITLGQDLRAHEIDIPYHTALIIYEEDIIRNICTVHGCTVAAALHRYNMALNSYDAEIMAIMRNFLRQGHGAWGFDNRNPTINETGIQYVRIRQIHSDITDYTMHIAEDVLGLLGADFDKTVPTYRNVG